ncbi:MAG TPA: AIM24 family protein, partial [Candidatus Ozemobacteraceae bacterium]|nr:AIM24 family protein [Candidatus Ozemobacteraceae bacterium]
FGGIYKISLAPGQHYVVDNGHLVAWSNTVQYEVQKASSGWLSSMTSGEGFVCHVRGPGDVWFQTRNPTGFGAWVRQFIPTKG